MANNFSEFLKDSDVVADAENIKKLLKMPYSSSMVSLVVHKVGKTLLLDELDIHEFLLRNSAKEWEWLKQFFYEVVFEQIERKEKALVKRSKQKVDDRILYSKFLYRSLESKEGDQDEEDSEKKKGKPEEEGNDGPDECLQAEESEPSEELKDDDTKAKLVHFPPLSDDSLEENLPSGPRGGNHNFARNLIWNFENLRMLIGSDMPIFGDEEHPAVSLRLHNSKKPINILTGMDYWLDNLMCQVPEVLMCYHLDGIVQKYEMIKTEDLPNLESGKFSTEVVRDIAKNILTFLKDNAAKEGHTYWLFKGKGDDAVKLYDLTALLKEAKEESRKKNGGGAAAAADSGADDEYKTPFTTAVSMLLYKLGQKIMNNTPEIRAQESPAARQLLEKCINLLDKDSYPHIASSAHCMLSEIFLPAGTDPAKPSLPVSEQYQQPVSSSSDGSGVPDLPQKSPRKSSAASKAVKHVDVSKLLIPNYMQLVNTEGSYNPPPLPTALDGRCESALENVVKGLDFLKELEEKNRRNEELLKKHQEWTERDRPKTANPNQAIPMHYETKTEDESRKKARSAAEIQTSLSKMVNLNNNSLTWHDKIKKLLLQKALLTYLTMAGRAQDVTGEYGTCLRHVKWALNCYEMIKAIHVYEDNSFILPCAFQIGASAYAKICQNWPQIVTYQEQYNSRKNLDVMIAEHIEKHVDESCRDWIIKLPKDVEEGLKLKLEMLKKGRTFVRLERVNNRDPAYRDQYQDFLKMFLLSINEMGVFHLGRVGACIEVDDRENAEEEALKARTYFEEGLETIAEIEAQGIDCLKSVLVEPKAMFTSNLAVGLQRSLKIRKDMAVDEDELESVLAGAEQEMLDIIKLFERARDVIGKPTRGQKHQRLKLHGLYEHQLDRLSKSHYDLGNHYQYNSPQSESNIEDIEKKVLTQFRKSLKCCEELTGYSDPLGSRDFLAGRAYMNMGRCYYARIKRKVEAGRDKEASQSVPLAEESFKNAHDAFTTKMRLDPDDPLAIQHLLENNVFMANLQQDALVLEGSNSKTLLLNLRKIVEAASHVHEAAYQMFYVGKVRPDLLPSVVTMTKHIFKSICQILMALISEYLPYKAKTPQRNAAKKCFEFAVRLQGRGTDEEWREVARRMPEFVEMIKDNLGRMS